MILVVGELEALSLFEQHMLFVMKPKDKKKGGEEKGTKKAEQYSILKGNNNDINTSPDMCLSNLSINDFQMLPQCICIGWCVLL